ncbi:peptidase C60 sortase A and B [Pseudofrankia inefficax]|uniref:Peptidase C60 sortase A and B n=1 Tax=Pseudofrankia inefficax (strain DSM 45817 / CECT 9037 / DDB 130130 / EuI1c) TaxID=298654 RepID=E3JAB1_PSEI1|nr:peptidase C60 sortase A and B [Pseudofrankia inefficax]
MAARAGLSGLATAAAGLRGTAAAWRASRKAGTEGRHVAGAGGRGRLGGWIGGRLGGWIGGRLGGWIGGRLGGRLGGLSRLSWPLALVGVALVVASGFQLAAPMIRSAEAPSGRALPPPAPVPTSPSGPPSATPSALPPPPVVTDPVRLRIPAIALDAPVIGLGLDPQGAIDVPTQWGDVGWYKPGVAPGAVGPAVLVGHYDSKTGPAVFYRLGSVLPGDQLVVVGASGASVTFVVDRLQEVSKATFPTQEVYGPVTRPEIRVITCDGAFDEHTHHYVDNLVVYGHAISVPASVAPAPAAAAPSAAVAAPRPAAATAAVRTGAPAAGSPAAPPVAVPPVALSPATPSPSTPRAAPPAAAVVSGAPPTPRLTVTPSQ